MVLLNILFDYTDKYNQSTYEQIIAKVKTTDKGEVELKTIFDKIKSYGFAKTRVSNLRVYYYDKYITCQANLI